MQRLVQYSLALTFVLALALFGVWGVSRAQPMPIAVIFTHPDGTRCALPCLFGVQPGETDYITANRLVRAHPLVNRQYLWERAGFGTVELNCTYLTINIVSDTRGRVAAISLYLRPDGPVQGQTEIGHGVAFLGDAMSFLGSPALVQASYRIMRFFYPAQGIVLTTYPVGTGQHVGFNDELSYLGVSAAGWFKDSWQTIMLTGTDWQGFVSLRHYQSRMRGP